MEKSVKPTLQLIAEKAGVSKMTVSRILRNYKNHNPKTREKVLQIAEELKYKKNPLIAALMTNLRDKKATQFRTAIALIQNNPIGYTTHPNRLNLRHGIHDEAEFHGFDVEVFNLNTPGMTPERLVQVLETRGFHCLLFEPFLKSNIRLDFDMRNFTAISTSSTLTHPKIDCVDIDQHTGLAMAMDKLRDQGYERPGFVAANISESINQNRRLGAFLFSQSRIPKKQQIPILWQLNDESAVKTQLKKWMDKYRPDSVISAQSKTPEYLVDIGFNVPQEIGFVHLSLSEDSGNVAGVNPNWYSVGAIATRQLIELLVDNEFGPPNQPKFTLIQPYWVDGQTLPQKFTPSFEVM